MTWAVEQNVPALQKIVLLMLANYCNSKTGQCNPGQATLAEECGLSLATCKRKLAELEELGLVVIEKRSAEGVSLPNQYVLQLGVGSGKARGQLTLSQGVGSQGATNQESSNLEIEPVGEKASLPSDKETVTGSRRKQLTTMEQWLETLEGNPIPETHPSRRYAKSAGIPEEFVLLAWQVFIEDMIAKKKKQKDWPATFTVYLKADYFRMWYPDHASGSYSLNAKGIARQRALEASAE